MWSPHHDKSCCDQLECPCTLCHGRCPQGHQVRKAGDACVECERDGTSLTAVSRSLVEQRATLDRVAAAFPEETAQTMRRRARRAAGLCRDCRGLAAPGRAQCPRHLAAGREESRRKRLLVSVQLLLPFLRAEYECRDLRVMAKRLRVRLRTAKRHLAADALSEWLLKGTTAAKQAAVEELERLV